METNLNLFIFDYKSIEWRKDVMYNLTFLDVIQDQCNHLLDARGYIVLNDVYDILNFPKTKEGCVYGWTKTRGEGFVDFGVDHEKRSEYILQNNAEIVLEFNMDGIIFDEYGFIKM